MGKYRDIDCPICKKSLENGETIVICPQCGAPYHKSCVDTVGHCVRDDLHASNTSWELPKAEGKYAPDEEKRCSRCGTLNPTGGLFCVVCGNQLHLKESDQAQEMPSTNTTPAGHAPPFQMPYDPYNTPFGGVNPDDSIEEIPVRDWAIFVGQNTAYFIPKFKDYTEQGRHASFNFSAMILGGAYFLYRKMFLWGALLLALRLVISIPAFLLQYDIFRQTMGGGMLFTNSTLVLISNLCFVFNLALMAACGTFTNRLYMYHCKQQIKKLKEQHADDNTYRMQLTEKGSVSRTVIVILIGGYFALSMGTFMFMMQSLL